MEPNEDYVAVEEHAPTQHGMLVVWGQFAQEIGLLDHLARIPIRQKKFRHSATDKLTEFAVGLLSGIGFLTDLTEDPAPICKDTEVAVAWRLGPLAEATGVSRTLRACDTGVVAVLRTALDCVSRPFLGAAVADLRLGRRALLLDADLTGRPVSSTSHTFPGAAFGHMDGEVRLGYQLAQICLQTRLFGRQWLSARHHPGDTVSGPCLRQLIEEAEERMGCHPRRRVELAAQRLAERQGAHRELERLVGEAEERVKQETHRAADLAARIEAGQREIGALEADPRSTHQAEAPRGDLNRCRGQVAVWEAQMPRARERVGRAQRVLERQRRCLEASNAQCARLAARHKQLMEQNSGQSHWPQCILRMDAGFSSGENLTAAIELGYDIDTKSGNAGLVNALKAKAAAEGERWVQAGKNAEMVAWNAYRISTCPYTLAVGLERFHTPQRVLYAALLRYRDEAPGADTSQGLQAWFRDYNGRQTIEAGNKEEKTTFKVQRLMSHSPAGIEIQALLTVFLANFVRWADVWVQPRVEYSTPRFDRAMESPNRLVRIAANSPAVVDRQGGAMLVRFGLLSSYTNVTIRLSTGPWRQLSLPLFEQDHICDPEAK